MQKPGLTSRATRQCLMLHHFLSSSKKKKLNGGIAPAPLHWSGCFWYLKSYLTLEHWLMSKSEKYVTGISKMGSNSHGKSYPKVSAIMGATFASLTISWTNVLLALFTNALIWCINVCNACKSKVGLDIQITVIQVKVWDQQNNLHFHFSRKHANFRNLVGRLKIALQCAQTTS